MNKAILLDRDGTLIVERDYLHDPDGVELERGVVPALQRLHAAGYLLVIITNQAGIGRGLYTEVEFRAVQERLAERLAEHGIPLAGDYHCPHHPTAGQGEYLRDCDCRKPGTALLEAAIRDFELDRAATFMVGDKLSDVGAGAAAGLRTVLVRTGYGALQAQTRDGPAPDHVADDLLAAVQEFILPVVDTVDEAADTA